jgi:hypothetical protein
MNEDQRREEIVELLQAFGVAGVEMDLEGSAEADLAYSMLRFLVCLGVNLPNRGDWEAFLEEALMAVCHQYGEDSENHHGGMLN